MSDRTQAMAFTRTVNYECDCRRGQGNISVVPIYWYPFISTSYFLFHLPAWKARIARSLMMSHNAKKENPIKRPREPPKSDTRESNW